MWAPLVKYIGSEVKCKTCGSDCCVDFTQSNCMLSTAGEITRKVGKWDIVSYTPVSFWYVNSATFLLYGFSTLFQEISSKKAQNNE